jgi:hypothetical protein
MILLSVCGAIDRCLASFRDGSAGAEGVAMVEVAAAAAAVVVEEEEEEGEEEVGLAAFAEGSFGRSGCWADVSVGDEALELFVESPRHQVGAVYARSRIGGRSGIVAAKAHRQSLRPQPGLYGSRPKYGQRT